MAHLEAVDISQYQSSDDYDVPIVMIKMSGGDAGVYYDSRASQHYYAQKAKGKAIGMYHFAGGTDPIVESNFFIRACSPLLENDVLALDWEVGHPDPVGWCKTFVENVHNQTGVWPLIYMNLSTLRAHDWNPVLGDCGLWLAAWNGDPEGTLDTGGHVYVMHQYRGSPLDLDAWYGSVEQFNKYGYHAAQPDPTPEPVPTPPPTPEPTPDPVPVPEPTPSPTPEPNPDPTPSPTPDPVPTPTPDPTPEPQPEPAPATGFWAYVIRLLQAIKDFLIGK